MAIPLILGGAALILAGTGAKKGLDAKDKNDKAERVVKNAKKRYKRAKRQLEEEKELLNNYLGEYAKYKLNIYTTRIPKLLKVIECNKKAKSKFNNELAFSKEEVKKLKSAVDNSYEILNGLSQGVISGGLTALGAYGIVGLVAEASTGATIASLSGAAATNATLAWLGGGSLATGGFGMAGGMIVLGGLVAGPAIAITGFVMDSKAEKNLTDAKKFRVEVDIAVENIEKIIKNFESVKRRVDELKSIVDNFISLFDKTYDSLSKKDLCKDENMIKQLLILGKSIKNSLEIGLINNEGNATKDYSIKLDKIIKEYKLEGGN